jgi:membrane-bound lytic murein transglycosylase D
VQTGDSLWNIAKRYGTTTREIQRQNSLTTTMLAVGQTLTIQAGPPDAGAPPTDAYKPYQVKRGDSPFKIAHKHNMPLEEFLRINQLVPRSKIYPGQTLFID